MGWVRKLYASCSMPDSSVISVIFTHCHMTICSRSSGWGIKKSKENPLRKLLVGLGIRFLGTKASELIAGEFGSMEEIMSQPAERFTEIPEIGEKIASSIVTYTENPDFGALIDKLEGFGVN